MAQQVRVYVEYAAFLGLPEASVHLGERADCSLVRRYLQGGRWSHPAERSECTSYFCGLCRKGGRKQIDCAFDDVTLDWRALRKAARR